MCLELTLKTWWLTEFSETPLPSVEQAGNSYACKLQNCSEVSGLTVIPTVIQINTADHKSKSGGHRANQSLRTSLKFMKTLCSCKNIYFLILRHSKLICYTGVVVFAFLIIYYCLFTELQILASTLGAEASLHTNFVTELWGEVCRR